LYTLLGTAGPPLASGEVVRKVTAKIWDMFTVIVANPLAMTQRFHLQAEMKQVGPTMLSPIIQSLQSDFGPC
jgi:hypothetical protein